MNEGHLWVPELDVTKGGVQSFSQFLQRGLQRVAPTDHWRTFAKYSPGANRLRSKTVSFAASLLWAGMRHRPRVVIASHVNFLPAARLLKRVCGTSYIGVAHGIEVWGVLRSPIRRALWDADAVWCVSRYTRDRIQKEQGVAPERLTILPNTFEQERFSPGPRPRELADRLRLPSDAKVIFSLGRLAAAERYKGFDRVIAALPHIRSAVPEVHYVIAGQGDDRERLETLARSVGVVDRVIFAGFVPTEELCAHYRLCDVFAMPSTGEGFGIVYLEAMACGKPVLAGNRDGSVEPLANGRFGALVDPLTTEEIAATLTNLLLGRHPNPLLWQPAELRRQVVAEFGFNRFCEQLSIALSRLPASGRPV